MVKLLNRENTALLIVDVQEKLMPVIRCNQRVTDNIIKLLYLSKLFNLPVILTEHYVKWLGPTISEIIERIPDYEPVYKMHFNCCEVDEFNKRLNTENLTDIIITGVESHICIFQTCVSILEKGYRVQVPQDAVDSRTEENWRVGIELMQKAGALITSTETIIYQILKKAGTQEFKKMLKLMR